MSPSFEEEELEEHQLACPLASGRPCWRRKRWRRRRRRKETIAVILSIHEYAKLIEITTGEVTLEVGLDNPFVAAIFLEAFNHFHSYQLV
jgi:hypothetical protein